MSPVTRLARGTVWASLDNWTAQLAQLLTFLWAGNIVGPSVVGVMSIALIAVTFAQHLLVDNLSEALVQRDEIERAHVASAFWSLGALGVIVMLAVAALAGPIAAFFDQPVLKDALRVLALVFPLLGASATMQAVLQRELRFRVLALRSIGVYAVASPVCITLAYAGLGVWSLVIYQVLIRAMDFILLALALGWLPRPSFSRPHFAEIWGYGRHSLKYRMVDFAVVNMERVIIGHFLGPVALGLFSLARRMVDSMQWALTGVINSVALALLSREQHDPAALGALLRRTVALASIIIIPAFAGLAAVAPVLIEALLRPQWLPMIPLVQVLCLYGLARSEAYFCATALRALGRIDLVYKVSLVVVAVQLVVFLAVVSFGTQAIAWAIVAVQALALTLLYRMVAARVPDAGRRRLRVYVVPGLASAIMVAVVLAASQALADAVPLARLAVAVGCGFLTYCLTLGALRPRDVVTAFTMLSRQLSTRRI
jgi:O-antigen/teichoic acid export membrane protein